MDQNLPDEGSSRAVDANRWKPGKYKAKPVDWSVSKTKAGLPQVVVLFEYQQQGAEAGSTETKQLMWFGSFKGQARERTLETLMNLGLRGPVSSLEEGRDGHALDPNQEVEIVVEHRINNGVKKAGIAWVNQLGGRGLQQGKLDKSEVQSLFADVDSEYMATMMAKGLQPKPKSGGQSIAQQIQQEQGMLGDSDIPF